MWQFSTETVTFNEILISILIKCVLDLNKKKIKVGNAVKNPIFVEMQ